MTKEETLKLQTRLNEIGFDAGPADGDFGKRTEGAVREFQKLNKLKVDGKPGKNTQAALYGAAPISPTTGWQAPIAIARPPAPVAKPAWPLQRDVAAFFGPAGGPRCTAGTVKLPIHFLLAWDESESIKSYRCHELVAPAFQRVFENALDIYGEKRFCELRLNRFSGCYNYRPMRGGSQLSMHAWGIATDLDGANNQLRWSRNGTKAQGFKDKAAFAKPEYEDFWKAVEAEGLVSLGRVADYDWMHFQAARR